MSSAGGPGLSGIECLRTGQICLLAECNASGVCQTTKREGGSYNRAVTYSTGSNPERDGIAAIQRELGVPADGIVGPITLGALRALRDVALEKVILVVQAPSCDHVWEAYVLDLTGRPTAMPSTAGGPAHSRCSKCGLAPGFFVP